MLIFFILLIDIVITLFLWALIYPLPISDTGNVRYSSIPVMTFVLITLNSLVFMFFQAFDLYQGSNAIESGNLREGVRQVYHYVEFIWTYGYRGVFMREGLSIGAFSTFTSMFM